MALLQFNLASTADFETLACSVVLCLSLGFLTANLLSEWYNFEGCSKPVHMWLLVSYALMMTYRLVHIGVDLGFTASTGVFLINLRQRSAVLRSLTQLVWLFIVPVYTTWSALGSWWVWDVLQRTPECIPNEMLVWCLMVFQVLSYCWICVHVGLGITAWWLERKVRKAEANLEQVADVDTLERWGNVSRIEGYTSLPQVKTDDHLTPEALLTLPGVQVWSRDASAAMDCPICLNALKDGDTVRQLPACSHAFHRSCIDLWLLRSADCPMCKTAVRGP